MKKILLSLAIIYCGIIPLLSQETDTTLHKKAQVSFAYPVGSNGINAPRYSNNFSLNILYGVNGGLHGVEIGSLFNYNKGHVSGAQLGGLVNYNTGNSAGLLVSGLANISGENGNGAHLSGITNYLSNARGLQLAGISNIATDSTKGTSISGVLNYSGNNAIGTQLSTINITNGTAKGFQLGVVNFNRKLEGINIGVINVSQNSDNGIPIGIINIVKNGYYELELATGETIFSNLSFKMGVEKLYTIYKIGYSQYKSKPVFSSGLGFGTLVSITDIHKIAIELSSNQIIYDNQWDDDLNLLNKADFNYKFQINNALSLHAGPSVNAYITQISTEDGYGTIPIPYSILSRENNNRKFDLWVGLNAGLSFRF